MTDKVDLTGFFEEPKDEVTTTSEGGGTVVEKVAFAGKEYSQEELAELVKLGAIAKEVEEKQSTKIDRLYPEYTKSRQEIKRMGAELEELKGSIAQRPQLPENEEQAIREAKEAARKLGIVTKEDFKDLLRESFREQYIQEREGEKLLDKVMGLEKEIDGADGRPRFDAETVLEYMSENGVKDPNVAYKLMYASELGTWGETQLSKAKKPGLETMISGGEKKEPKEIKITGANFDKLLREALEGQ